MSGAKYIGMFGLSQTDLTIYVASIIQNLSHTAACCDNSYEGAGAYCIPKPDGDVTPISYKNIDYYRLVPDVGGVLGYDYVITDFGVWPDFRALENCDELFLILDPSVSLIEKYRQFVVRLARPVDVILRGFLPDMVSVKKIQHLFEAENPFVQSFYTLEFHEDDEVRRIGMQYDRYHGFAGVSKQMEKLLIGMCRKVTEAGDAAILTAYKRARRGECA